MHRLAIILSGTGVVIAAPAQAEEVELKPLIDARLRLEAVDQTSFAQNANVVTARVRAGIKAKTEVFVFLVEAESTVAISKDHNSGVNGLVAFPVVADPQNVELNSALIQFTGLPKTIVTVGRQRINLDDQRFVGSVGFRQNEQTFDAARIEWSGIKDIKADITYAWSNRTIWGIDGFGARQQSVTGGNVFANLSYKHKIGTLAAFAYLVDQDEAAVSAFRLSSKSFGAHFAGATQLSKAAKLTYALSYAKQNDYRNNPNNYSADYWLAELGGDARGWKLLGGYEVLGANTGAALTSFQTPLATLHKFNGWADKFLVTPPNGLRDAYALVGYSKPKFAGFDSIGLTATYHDYRSDRLSLNYGDEWGAQLIAKRKKYTVTLKYADYSAKAFATDTKKFWASVDWAI